MSSAVGASVRRLRTVFGESLAYHARRPLFIVWALTLGLTAWAMSSGTMQIRSGDATVGGTKAYVTSEFAVAMQLSVVTLLFYGFFVAVAAGMVVIQDEQWRTGDLLQSSSLRPGEYIWAKFAAVLVACAAILVLHIVAMLFFNHVLPNAEAQEMRGPLHLSSYVRPALIFALPTIIFLAGASFALGAWTRKPLLVYMLPVLLVSPCIFFLWEWSPNWLDPKINDLLMWLDPAGFRWLNETWLKIDRGVAFYNNESIPPDRGFLISRGAWIALGLIGVLFAQRHFAKVTRGVTSRRLKAASYPSDAESAPLALGPLASLGMTTVRPGLWSGAYHVAKAELAELRSSPGLYLFAPLILLQTIGTSLVEVGFLDTSLLVTPGTFAVKTMGPLAFWLCLLFLFYVVNTLEREKSTQLASIAYATPIRTGSIFLGKSAALFAVALVIMAAVALGGLVVLLVQQKVGFAIAPFLLVWGLLLVPTLVAWSALVLAFYAITQNRYGTIALALPVLLFTGYRTATGEINWVGNWPLWSAVRWSDLSVLELDRTALFLSRLLAASAAAFLVALALSSFRRREWDATRVLHRLSPRPLARASLWLLPWAALPLFFGIYLALEVGWGHDGGAAKKRAKDYWRKNVATYVDARVPDINHVALDLDLYPERSRYHVKGSYELINRADQPLDEILLTAGSHWEKLVWTVGGAPASPDNRSGLYVFSCPESLAPGKTVQIGFEHEGSFPRGISKKGGSLNEFILPSAAVLTSFQASVAPLLGFAEQAGVDDDNRHDPKEYRVDFYKGQTDSFLGARTPFTTRIQISGPVDFTMNSVGTKTSDTVAGNRRIVVWESDHPVSFFNVVAGRWDVERGVGTAVYYNRAHSYNIAEIRESLDAARRHYSEWFYPFPWQELKLSEFPNLATYAQGFPTDITFSEGVGFLTKSTPENHAAFEITAHESAHQWWGNILVPGKGPGGNILAEGTAHFSTILLVEQIKGPAARIDFCKRLEANYNRDRQSDSERPLVKITSERPGDTTVTYDKGGWVFWMLLNHMGRDRALRGIQAFIKAYAQNPDHPVLQDFVALMRGYAADPGAYDAFTRQWFFEVVVPEYRVEVLNKAATGEGSEISARLTNIGTGTMPVEIAATRGTRFGSDGSQASDYRDTRAQVTLGAGESREVVIQAPFQAEQVVVDPDARVLQLRRKRAVAPL
jgi:ABC-2 type transport system permease protein